MHKIVLYNPESVFYTMPLALLAISSNLDKSKYKVVIIDSRLEKGSYKKLIDESKDALCVGMSVLTGAPISDALEASRKLKFIYPELPVIWGGWHASLFPIDTLNEKSIDITVQGQGEITFKELLERLSIKESLNDVNGICFKDRDGTIIQNPPRAIADMNDFKYQRYELLSVNDYYDLKKQRQFDYISSTGCFFRCSFCADPYVYKRKWSALNPKRMGDEIEILWKKYKFTELAFQDETFFTYKDRVVEIGEEFIKRGLKFKWTATMRADQGARLTEDVVKLLVNSGLRWVLIGVESGSQEMLDWLKKDIKVEQILHCAELCKRHGVHVNFPSIVGFPGESDKSVDATLDLIKRLRQLSPKFETPIFYFKPYPGSSITQKVVEEGYRLPESLEEWAEFDFIGSSGPWVSEEKYQKIERFKFYNRFAGGPNTIIRRPLRNISRWRLDKKIFSLPIEKYIVETLKPLQKLS